MMGFAWVGAKVFRLCVELSQAQLNDKRHQKFIENLQENSRRELYFKQTWKTHNHCDYDSINLSKWFIDIQKQQHL